MSARKGGRPAADPDGLANAAIWLLHLKPDAERANTLTDVADKLLASEVRAVIGVVGAAGRKTRRTVIGAALDAGRKTLRNRLSVNRRRDVLAPEWPALGQAFLWAKKAGLPVIPMVKIGELPQAGVFPRTYGHLQQFERDEWELVFALSEWEDTLSAAAREALGRVALRRLRRMRELADELGLP